MTMTDLTELCYSHTDLKPLNTIIARVKKMDVLVLNKSIWSKSIRNPACRTQIELDHHLVPFFYITVQTDSAGAVALHITARNIRVSALFHSK
jgi:hypothetical protein